MNSIKRIYLKDYSPPKFLTPFINLSFRIDKQHTQVTSQFTVVPNPSSPPSSEDSLIFHGDPSVELISISLNGKSIDPPTNLTNSVSLHIPPELQNPNQDFSVTLVNKINPSANTELSGFYKAGENLFLTQCEPEGFRRITWSIDRPDNMAKITTLINAPMEEFPVLLSNGVLKDSGPDPQNPSRHFALWEDKYPKATYLFALVAGQLAHVQDSFTTKSGKKVSIHFYCDHGDESKLGHAINSLKAAFKWDEDTWGREFYNNSLSVISTHSFAMGAMENQFCFIFNSKYILADSSSATDSDFRGVENVIAHEFFHSWTGNRVTLKSWPYLTLKEGLTVYRDQTFSSDMFGGNPVLKRIQDVNVLTSYQFPEDNSPLSHPIVPPSYTDFNNFYTSTVYEKGAEVIRMMETITGREKFRKGMDLYFDRHDFEAVTTEDFVKAIEDGSGLNFGHFRKWYSTNGTPHVDITSKWDKTTNSFILNTTQSNPTFTKSSPLVPLHIPMATKLISKTGTVLFEGILNIHKENEQFTIQIDPHQNSGSLEPIPSLFCNFSAPVTYKNHSLTPEARFHQACFDTDQFNRYKSCNDIFISSCIARLSKTQSTTTLSSSEAEPSNSKLKELISSFLEENPSLNKTLDPGFVAVCLQLPSQSMLEQHIGNCIDPLDLLTARENLASVIGSIFDWNSVYHQQLALESKTVQKNQEAGLIAPDSIEEGHRSLKNLALYYLSFSTKSSATALQEFTNSSKMTDLMASMPLILKFGTLQERQEILDTFYKKFSSQQLTMDKWFSVQTLSTHPQVFDWINTLLQHKDFDYLNPNRLRSVVLAATQNPLFFHKQDGSGYKILIDFVIKLNHKNSQMAARILKSFRTFHTFAPRYSTLMKQQLERLNDVELSNGPNEIFKALMKN